MKKIEVKARVLLASLRERTPKIFYQEFLADSNIVALMFLSGSLLVLCWIYALVKFRPSEFLVPIKYSSFLGVTQLGQWYDLYRFPLIATLCFFLNIILSNLIYRRDKMIAYILISANIFLMTISLSVIINISGILEQ